LAEALRRPVLAPTLIRLKTDEPNTFHPAAVTLTPLSYWRVEALFHFASRVAVAGHSLRTWLPFAEYLRMFFRRSEIITTGAVAIGRIEVLRMHAAGIYVAPAIGEFFDCKCLRNQAGVSFLGRWDDARRAHLMLAMIRSEMDQEFAEFLSCPMGSRDHPKSLAASFAQGMGNRVGQRLRRLKSGRTTSLLVRGKDLGDSAAKAFRALASRRFNTPAASIGYWAGVEAGSRVRLT
jgi:hypothetical protein